MSSNRKSSKTWPATCEPRLRKLKDRLKELPCTSTPSSSSRPLLQRSKSKSSLEDIIHGSEADADKKRVVKLDKSAAMELRALLKSAKDRVGNGEEETDILSEFAAHPAFDRNDFYSDEEGTPTDEVDDEEVEHVKKGKMRRPSRGNLKATSALVRSLLNN